MGDFCIRMMSSQSSSSSDACATSTVLSCPVLLNRWPAVSVGVSRARSFWEPSGTCTLGFAGRPSCRTEREVAWEEEGMDVAFDGRVGRRRGEVGVLPRAAARFLSGTCSFFFLNCEMYRWWLLLGTGFSRVWLLLLSLPRPLFSPPSPPSLSGSRPASPSALRSVTSRSARFSAILYRVSPRGVLCDAGRVIPVNQKGRNGL